MKPSSIAAIILGLVSLSLPACERMHAQEHGGEEHHEQQKIVLTHPILKNVTVTQQYVCQIHAQRNIEVRALQEGYLEPIQIKEGQTVKAGQVLFSVVPTLYKTRLDAEVAEAQYARVERDNAKRLFEQKIVSGQELALYEAKLTKAEAKVAQAQAELNFTVVTARFDGIVDRLYQQQGSLVKKEDLLTTLSDNSVMWVYFNVPEARYLDYKVHQGQTQADGRLKLLNSRIELVLADGSTFDQPGGDTVTVEGKFNNETGNIKFRADFANPHRLLRHGQTGSILVHRTIPRALVIPQRATFEILDKRYVYVVDEHHVAHQRLIAIQEELDDVFIIKSGIDVGDKIVLEGVRQIHDGSKLEDVEEQKPEEALSHQKFHAE